jgi:MFS family permease
LRDGLAHLRGHRPALLGITAVSIGHVVMVMVMVMTPVHMAHVDVSLRLIGLVISVHVLGMFALSPVVGWAVDRFGRIPVIVLGAAILLVSCVVSGLAPADDVLVLGVGLFLLGLGWSCTLIAGSTLLTDAIDPADRPSIQGLSDLSMNVAGAVGGGLAGVIVLGSSYAALCAVACVPVMALLALVAAPSMRRPVAV